MMNEDEKAKAYNAGFKAGQSHAKPSPDTIKFMSKIDQQISHINDKLKAMPTRDEMLLFNEKLVERIFLKANEKYASKIVEKIVYSMIGLLAGSFFIALIILVFKSNLVI